MTRAPKAKGKAKAPKALKTVQKVAESSRRPHNWDLIAADYIEGIEPGDGQPRFFPSQRDLVRKWKCSPAAVSKQARIKDANGKDWDQRREDFQKAYREKRQAVVVEHLVSKEAAFRELTLAGADLVVRHCVAHLHRGLYIREGKPVSALPPDTLSKLSASLKNAQATGLVSIASDEEGKDPEGGSDWTKMRQVRAGLLPVPEMPESADPAPTEGAPDA